MVAGYAIGGGHVLHLVCDLTIAADNAQLRPDRARRSAASTAATARATWRASSARRRRARSGSSAASTTRSRRSTWASSTRSCRWPSSRTRRVKWCREMLEHSPIALRCLKAALNADCDGQAGLQRARRQRDPALLHERGGEGREERLPREAQAGLQEVPAGSLSPAGKSGTLRRPGLHASLSRKKPSVTPRPSSSVCFGAQPAARSLSELARECFTSPGRSSP